LPEKQTSINKGKNSNKEEKCSERILGEMAKVLLVLTERIDIM